MDKKSDLELSHEFLMNSSEDIVSILKTIAHINRFRILILLLNGPLTFQTLLEKIDLKKSALANHLTELKDSNLVEKTHHGTYEISENGKNYIKSIEKIYKESKVIEKKVWEAKQREQLSKSFLERKQ
ncbi:MAG: helix-turn-helix domain-containing protein [Methanosarcina vacuolata]|jgi:predicted transcriptional regulator|uniref:ArsR/SmtB family transcription factor n=1 Tax=Methanosarcina sp. DH1 TaxID=2605695 RepID=UPI001E2E6588|nr:ArsR family transcriptional regulator [Methanosarcina sp. DH1]MCC4765463.1 helix-turn-helix domain-containing protein [Methanosarcina sp. DH1]MDY0130811.1 helix-turn-helix domain-containing protein [Methanosarcina vacuolata]